jgi:RNA polymerase sigma factor (sigma-70 family)
MTMPGASDDGNGGHADHPGARATPAPTGAAVADPSDEALYLAFARSRAQDAFTALVRRHSRMVHCVARRVTGDSADADDVLQATFLALAQHAQQGRAIVRLASWLHRVARNLATHRRDAAMARRRHERSAVADVSTHHAGAPDADADADADTGSRIRAAMDQALDGLPERYRLPLILHYLEGRSFTEIASDLQTTTGTVASWLSRGRALLRARLDRLGHPLAGATLVLVLAELGREDAAGAELPGPDQLGEGSRGAAIRDLAAHARGARPHPGSLALLALGLAATLTVAAWTARERAAGTPTREVPPDARAAAPSPPPPPPLCIDLAREGIGYYHYLAVEGQSPAAAAALVAGVPLAQVGS